MGLAQHPIKKGAGGAVSHITICTSDFSSSKADLVSKEAGEVKESPTKTLPIANISPEVAEQFEDAGKAVDTTKEVA